MFPHPLLPARRRPTPLWDHGYYYSHSLTRTPSLESLPPTPSSNTPPSLPSRVAALNRRAALVSATLAHLTAVVKPLETTTPEHLSRSQLADMLAEGAYLEQAMRGFEEQMEEVWEVLRAVVEKRGRRGEEREVAFEAEEWGFGSGGRARERGMGRKRIF